MAKYVSTKTYGTDEYHDAFPCASKVDDKMINNVIDFGGEENGMVFDDQKSKAKWI